MFSYFVDDLFDLFNVDEPAVSSAPSEVSPNCVPATYSNNKPDELISKVKLIVSYP
jgi:hypothetical protein